ncbi:MAG TPA: cytochrome P450 [Actinomycetales bacterium]|jgi:fatty-acid peroxygenase
MTTAPGTLIDSSLPLLREGYAYFPNTRRRTGSDVVRTRLLGQPAVCLVGPEAAEFFYSDQLERSSAIPGPIRSTLFGHGSVHSMDDAAHHARKSLFTSLLVTGDPQGMIDACVRSWCDAADLWCSDEPVSLFDASAQALMRGVCSWVGVDVPASELAGRTRDMVSMVDGFGSAGVRHVRARLARGRSETWMSSVVRRTRAGALTPTPTSPLAVVCAHRGPDGELLPERVAAVELLNLIRPTVAICWFVAYAGHALTLWPEHREGLRDSDEQVTAFVHELRRFYPFAPFLGARARHTTRCGDTAIDAGTLVLLDIYGQHHDARVFPDPYSFSPARWVGRHIDPFILLPQGGGDTGSGHRCPGEHPTVAILAAVVSDLAQRDLDVPAQDLSIPLGRMPARVRSGVVVQVRDATAAARPDGRRTAPLDSRDIRH